MIHSAKNIELPSGFKPGFAVEVELKRELKMTYQNHKDVGREIAQIIEAKAICIHKDSVEKSPFVKIAKNSMGELNTDEAPTSLHTHGYWTLLSGNSLNPCLVLDNVQIAVDATRTLMKRLITDEERENIFNISKSILKDADDIQSKTKGLTHFTNATSLFTTKERFDIFRAQQMLVPSTSRFDLATANYGGIMISPLVGHARGLIGIANKRNPGDAIYIGTF